jgi:hypothetical protein
MVVGSLSPLFILLAIRGARDISDRWWLPFCLAFAIFPNAALWYRWHLADTNNDQRTLIARSSKDQSEHLLVYLFAMLIPLFGVDVGSIRDAASVFVAFLFVVFIFWHMKLHYINIVFAVLGYNVFTVEAATSRGDRVDAVTRSVVVLSKRHSLPPDTQLDALRLSDTVFIEKDQADVR